MHVSLFLLTPASFALLASSCCRVWCQLLALVGLNSSIEAGRAKSHSAHTPPPWCLQDPEDEVSASSP